MLNLEQFIGKSLKEAKEIHGNLVVITEINGTPQITTCDFRPNRLRVEIEGDCIQYETRSRTRPNGEVVSFQIVIPQSLENAIIKNASFG